MTLHITGTQTEGLGVWVAFGFVFYFLPFAIAVLRQNGREGFVLLVDAVLAWTIVGWFAAMYLALHDAAAQPRPLGGGVADATARRRQRRRSLYSTSNLSTFSS
jgi:hypothetical protein